LSTSFGTNLPPIPGMGNTLDITNYTSGLSIQQNLWDFGRTSSISRKAVLSGQLSHIRLESKKQEIIYSTKKDYYNLLQAKALEKLSDVNLKEMKNLLESVQERYKEGVATEVDVLNIEAEYEKFYAGEKKAGRNVDLATIALLNTAGLSEDEEIIIKNENFSQPEEYPLGLKDFQECKSRALLFSHGLKELDLQKQLARAGISGVRSEWFPVISGAGEYGFQDTVFPPKQKSWSAGVNLSLPLFSGFGSVSRMGTAHNDLKNISENKRQLTQKIILQVKNSYYKVLEQKENVYVSEKKMKYLEKNLQAVNAKYKEGLATLTELIDSQTKKSAGEIENQQALYNYHTALNELEYNIGGVR
ncbi:MAG: TolC family protein, partial [Elusimicrobiota bacterium]